MGRTACTEPQCLYNEYRVFPGGKERPGRDGDPSLLLVPLVMKSRAISLLPLRAVRSVQSLVPVQGCILPLPLVDLWTSVVIKSERKYRPRGLCIFG
jgi:hypothetical protein